MILIYIFNLAALITVAGSALRALVTRRKSKEHQRRRYFEIVYVCLDFACATLGTIPNFVLTTKSFVYHNDTPGEAALYMAEAFYNPFNDSGFVAFVIAAWLQDGYLV